MNKINLKYYCKLCKEPIGWKSALYGSGLCMSCACKERDKNRDKTDIKNPNYIDGRTLIEKHCIICNKIISFNAKFCKTCSHLGIKRPEHSIRMSGRKHPRFGKIASHGKGQWYKDYFMRSSYELVFAKFLDDNNTKWCYESKAFDLGNCTYTPDFYLPETDEYIEIKGWWREDAKFKYELFKIFYPNKKIQVLMQKDLKELQIL